jgi:hypothetical protein
MWTARGEQMGLQEDRLRSLRFEGPEQIPVSVSILPAAWMKHREALDEVVARHPALFGSRHGRERDYDEVGGTYVAGEQDVGFPHGLMYLRLGDLRGFEELMLDFAEEPPELKILLDTVLAYNLRQAEFRLAQLEGTGQIVYFGDDLGMQTSLPISPPKWRKYLKPCYCQIYRPFREAGHYVYMHSDGHIHEIIPDLVDCGVNVINPQVRANGLDNLAAVCRSIVCVDLDLDRQLFPFATPAEIDAHVREAVETLGSPQGGLWLKAEIGFDVPLENVDAICAALERYRTYYSWPSPTG